ncbi:hypothetical protein M3Y97_00441600 [Aphelenchoides bicaudatus]|nr:hypothetical protein M3Y97_00441600 [Aphelenchoides bicaudatus]
MFKNYMGLAPFFQNSDNNKFLSTPMDQRLYVTGLCGDNQFGTVRGEENDSCVSKPTLWYIKPDNGSPDPIVQFCLGERHSTVTLEIIGVVDFRKKLRIVQIASGQTHNLAITDDGRLFSWGSNEYQQCGFAQDRSTIWLPERVDGISQVCQIACGSLSSMCLLESNKVMIFGWYIGQAVQPFEVELFNSIPVRQISAGADHFAVVSCGGSLLCWGRNEHNQTSVINQEEVREPVAVCGLNHVIQVACGANHTVALTRDGNVYTFGDNKYGQLGIGKRSKSLNAPQQVKELKHVKSIAAGSGHSLALTTNRIHSFGLNNNGQLSVGTFNNTFSPSTIPIMNPRALFAGWEQSVVLCGETDWIQKLRQPRFIDYKEFAKLMQIGDTIEIVEYLMFAFTSLGCLNGSFVYDTSNQNCLMINSGLYMDDCMKFFNLISESSNSKRFCRYTKKSQSLFDQFRFFMILPWFHPMIAQTNEVATSLLDPFVKSLHKLLSYYGHVIRTWWGLFETRHFNRIVSVLMNYLEFVFNRNHRDIDVLKPLLSILQELCQKNKETNKVPYNKFYLNNLNDKVNVRQEYINSVILKHPDKFAVPRGQRIERSFWCDYPFLLNAEAKAAILEADSGLRMQLAVSASRAPWAQILPIFDPEDTFLTYHVRRSNIVDDAYENVMRTTENNVAKPLRVIFAGEDAEDRGGVRKEFFALLFYEMLQPTYGMFSEDHESHFIWFTGIVEELVSYEVIGFLTGLAIHNFVLINTAFPLALYKKILNQPITLEDSLNCIRPKVIQYEGDDLEDVFCLDFSVNMETFGHSTQIDLIENGSNVPVTQKNKARFVELYIERKMELGANGLIKDQLNAFIRGFTRVLNPDVLNLFQPRELMEISIGNENYDWQVFKQNTEYKGEYYSKHPAILAFWDVFFELTSEEKRMFLLFLTGTDRIPLKGMQEIKMFIQPEPEELLPVAHTCFNLLDLPKLTDRKEMKRLMQASTSKPFHILGFSENEENIQPLEIAENDTSKDRDVVRGLILCGLVRRLLNKLSMAQDLLNANNKPAPQTIDQLRAEIETLHTKIRAEEHRNQDFADELNEIKESCIEKSDNIEKEIQKLRQFCEHFRSRTFMEQYNTERQLGQLELDFKMEQELGSFLEARLEVEREKKEKLLSLMNKH